MQKRDGSEERENGNEFGLFALLLSGFVGVAFAALILLVRSCTL